MVANSIITPTKVLRETTVRLTNQLKFVGQIYRGYSKEFREGGAKVGTTINARLPQRYIVTKGQLFQPQAQTDAIVPISITDQANVAMEYDTLTMTMQLEDFRKRNIDPAAEALANQIDFDGLQRSYQDVYQTVGTPGVIPGAAGTPVSANLPYMLAGTKLDNASVVRSGRVAILSSEMHTYLASANQTLFAPSGGITKQYKTGQFGSMALGVERWFMDQNVPVHVVGPQGGTPLTNGALQSGSSIVTDGWTAAAANRLKKGDVIQIAGVFAVNPMNRQSTGELQDFVVTSDVDSDGSGNATIPVSPALIAGGALQTVSALPADNAAITVFGAVNTHANKSSKQGLIFREEAFAFVTADLERPQGVWASERISNPTLGIAVRFVKDYSILTDQSPARLDTIYGFKTVRPELAVRIAS